MKVSYLGLVSWRHILIGAPLLLLLALIVAYLAVIPTVFTDRRRRFLPPGPRGLPLIGNWRDLRRPDVFFRKAIAWKETYGDVFHVKFGGADYIFLSSPQSVKALMDQRSSIYSSRPPQPLAGEVASAGRRQLFMPYGPRYRTVRRISHDLLNSRIVTDYQPIQDLESKQLLFDMLNDPANFYLHNRRYSASVIITATYGHRIDSFDHPLARKVYSVVNNMQLYMEPGAWLVDSLPALKALPQWLLGRWRDFGEKCFQHDHKVYLALWENLKKEVKDGRAKDCFCKRFLASDPEKLGLDTLQAAYQAGGLVEAGSETTSAFLNTAILQLTKHPEVQRKAQEEIDRVVGSERLPAWEDEPKLPYLLAIIKETLRMRPPNKFGINHYTTEDDWYEGMFIPKNTIVTLNWWATNYDPNLWTNPYEYRPERYLSYTDSAAAYLNIADPTHRDHWSYGAGRRVCPGIHLAEKSLYLNIARLLWGFRIGKRVVDKRDVEPSEEMVKGWMCIPGPFECDIVVRSEKHAEIIRDEWREAEKGINIDAADTLI
ncbi:hypothetical protein LTR53_006141 [Teratosphaeriaceae sp. CCFEE 6253]|nr:hypothetical protein LTR53_006141 [Teratosphaeriaceae sp. CCFEE 6253]